LHGQVVYQNEVPNYVAYLSMICHSAASFVRFFRGRY